VHPSATDLAALRPWVETGDLRPKVAGVYALDDLGAAHQRSQEGRVVGKLVVTL
jgi:NADPH:quinone reductase-like Zn-dependent oxidoreductase